MANEYCQICGKYVYPLPYICKYCGGVFCVEHRLPEKHNCEKLAEAIEKSKTIKIEDLVEEIVEFEKAQKERSKGLLKRFSEKIKFKKGG
jgi:hypothetical protein